MGEAGWAEDLECCQPRIRDLGREADVELDAQSARDLVLEELPKGTVLVVDQAQQRTLVPAQTQRVVSLAGAWLPSWSLPGEDGG